MFVLNSSKVICVVGLVYVGLPLAVEFGKHRPVVGFDINPKRIVELHAGQDHTLECSPVQLNKAASQVRYSHQLQTLRTARFLSSRCPRRLTKPTARTWLHCSKPAKPWARCSKKAISLFTESTMYPARQLLWLAPDR
jgi:UDP-N-acetyl-D-galactosamine dehydrogenase